jgi:hypothetical protein
VDNLGLKVHDALDFRDYLAVTKSKKTRLACLPAINTSGCISIKGTKNAQNAPQSVESD